MIQDSQSGTHPLAQPQVTRLEHIQSGDKGAAIFSVDFGDGLPPSALVLLVARSQSVRICELYQHSSGETEAPLARALGAYSRAVDAITADGAQITRHSFGGPARVVPARVADFYPAGWPSCPGCGEPALDGKVTCGRVQCGSSSGAAL
jgi:hypothetical protein